MKRFNDYTDAEPVVPAAGRHLGPGAWSGRSRSPACGRRERDIISGAEHDEFFLDVNLEELAKIATEEDVKNLLRCGVIVSEYDCLRMSA